MSRKTETTFREQLGGGQIIAPFVYDCLGARMAENTGFRTFVLSTSALAMAYGGVPAGGLLSADEVIDAATRLSDFLPYPVIAEFGDGFGQTPYIVWRNVRRLVKGETQGVIIDDSAGVRSASGVTAMSEADTGLASEDDFLAKIRAAVDAASGTDCVVIAASNATSSLAESILRLKKAKKLGADLVLCRGLASLDDCRALAAEVPGPKMFSEYSSASGLNARLDELAELGFGIVTVRYLERAALFGLMDYALRAKADGNLVYVDYHDFDGLLPGLDHHIRLLMPPPPVKLEDPQ